MTIKTDMVKQWWKERLDQGCQLADPERAVEEGYYVSTENGWKSRIETSALWDDFKQYLVGYPPVIANQFTKSGFMLMFYRVTGACKGRTRIGQINNEMRYVARFEDVDTHRTMFNEQDAA